MAKNLRGKMCYDRQCLIRKDNPLDYYCIALQKHFSDHHEFSRAKQCEEFEEDDL